MASTIKIKDTTGTYQTINIDPMGSVVVSLYDETVPLEVTIQGPIYSTTYSHVGGRPKDRQ